MGNDPDFWHKLALQFGEFPFLILAANHIKSISTTGEVTARWEVNPPGGSYTQRWKRLAIEAGEALDPTSEHPQEVWLDQLLRQGQWPVKEIAGLKGAMEVVREIGSLAVVSQNECMALELKAAEARSAARRASLSGNQHESVSVVAVKMARQSGAIQNLHASRRTEKHLSDKGIRQADFAARAKISERTLRSFLRTGKLRKNSLPDLCKALKIDQETLLGEFPETGN